ncbi:MAG: response regulator [Cyanothece sp. SIO1E1]|nr:response regulator [Cyanothece sp. SIO1E1]
MQKIITGLKKEGLIYVVDNHRLYRDIIKLALEQEGYTVRLFEDGSHVLKALTVNKSFRGYMPDLIICELNMRAMDGLVLLDKIKKHFYLQNPIPFLFMTSSENNNRIEAAQERSGNLVFDKRILLHPLAEWYTDFYSNTNLHNPFSNGLDQTVVK